MGDSTTVTTTATLRKLIIPVYLPIVLGSVGSAMLVPVLPLYLIDRGLSLSATSVVLAGAGIGAAFGGLPAGALIARHGERVALLLAFAVFAIALTPLGLTELVVVLMALRILAGVARTLMRLSRQTFVTRRVIAEQRGRALSLVGGSFRLSFLIGPLLGGWLVDAFSFTVAFVVAGLIALAGIVPAAFSERSNLDLLDSVKEAAGTELGLLGGIQRHWRRLGIAGAVPLLVMAARSGRLIVLPLIADELGSTATEVGLIVAISTAVDLALFPVAGWIMDRFGRLAAMIPSFAIVALGLVGLGLASTSTQVVLSGVVIGVGNGLGAGTMLTLGSDLAPPDAPGPFLAGLAAIQDIGGILGALVVGFVGDAAGLGASSIVLALLLTGAIAWLLVVIGETSAVDSRRSAALR